MGWTQTVSMQHVCTMMTASSANSEERIYLNVLWLSYLNYMLILANIHNGNFSLAIVKDIFVIEAICISFHLLYTHQKPLY